MSWNKYNILRTQDEVLALDAFLTDTKPELLSVDTETNGLHFWKNVVIGFSLSTDSSSGFYIPMLEWQATGDSKSRKVKKKAYDIKEEGHFQCIWTGETYPEDVTPQQYRPPQLLIDFIQKWFTRIPLIMHNAVFDVLMIESTFGVTLEEHILCDTGLLKHIIDENSSNGLKQIAIMWQDELGLDVGVQANQEQIELGNSVIRNGGKFSKKEKHIWRADGELLGKYAVADTFLTYGIFEVGMRKLWKRENPEKYLKWFYEDEVMPLCKEVMIGMKRRGVRVNDEYFRGLLRETKHFMECLEDEIHDMLGTHLSDFTIGRSLDEAVSKKRLVEKIIELEGLEYPVWKSTKNKGKKSLSKQVVEKHHEEEPHWLWGYILGEDELKYSDERLEEIKKELYLEVEGRRHRFNIGSRDHVRWLFFKKLGYDPESVPQTDTAVKFNRKKKPDEPKKIIPQMTAEVIQDNFASDHEWCKSLLLWYKIDKLFGTYIKPAVELSNNGYLHMDFVQNGTVSGRFACRGGFNLQTLPKVEELDRCPKCKGNDHKITNPIQLVANIECECGYSQTGILCPSAIKQGFTAPEGNKIINADYSSLEPRCFSFCSGDPKLKEIYWKNLDFYSKIYCDISDPDGLYSPDPKDDNFLKKVNKEARNGEKGTALGIPYGSRAYQVAVAKGYKKEYVDRKTGTLKVVADRDAGQAFIDKYLGTYPKLAEFMEESRVQALTKGYVETIVGRRRHFKTTVPINNMVMACGQDIEWFLDIRNSELETDAYNEVFTPEALAKVFEVTGINPEDDKTGDPRTWAFVRAIFKNEYNNCINFRIQGLAAHITNMAMLEITREIKHKKYNAWVCLNVHDEVTGYAAEKEIPEVEPMWKDKMENNMYTALVDLPMIAEPIVCDTIKEAK